MTIRTLTLAALSALALGLLADRGFSDDPPEDPAGADWAQHATPGPQHEWLGGSVGTWSAKTKFWMGPGEPMEGSGTYRAEWSCDGRFIKDSYDDDSGTFHGEGYIGFNNGSEKFERVWLDTMGTGMGISSGTREGNTISLSGEYAGPGGKVVHSREKLTVVGPDEMNLEMWNDMSGQMLKTGEITFHRK